VHANEVGKDDTSPLNDEQNTGIIDSMTPMERELEAVLLRRYEQWKQVSYRATRFKRMLTPTDPTYKGPVGTVRHLLGKEPSQRSGFNRLKTAGRLDLTVEALFDADEQWHSLFAKSEIFKARERYRAAKGT
jgi:hypothetical protein